MAKWYFYASALILLFAVVAAVDRGNFKTCEQSSFCKRNRALKYDQSPYYVDEDSVEIGRDRLSAVLRDQQNANLSLTIQNLQFSTVRVTIDEVNGLRERFRPLMVLDSDPKTEEWNEFHEDKNSVTLATAGNDRIVIQLKPFRLDVFHDKDLTISLNSQSLLNFETFRRKPGESVESKKNESLNVPAETAPDELPDTEDKDTKAAEEFKDDSGAWEEHFKSHHDSKPYGPSSVGLDVNFIGFEHIFGIPEHADTFSLRSTKHTDPYRLYNLDVFEYEVNNPMALYGAVPYVVAHNAQRTVGAFWLNAAETWVDIRSSQADQGFFDSIISKFRKSSDTPVVSSHWMSESGVVDLFLLLGPKPVDIFKQYSTLTGVNPLPPLFAIAYHQCRWNYNDMDDVRSVDTGFDVHDIPYDVIWLDIEHTDGKKYFTWDSHKFSDSKAMIDNIASKGRKMVAIIDPHIKRDDSYKVYKEAKDSNFFVKGKDGVTDFDGWCWPGASAYLDFMNPAVCDYWAKQYHLSNYQGSTESLWVWNDMNEPSVFNGPEVTMHKDAKHHGGWEHRDVHNIYGFLNHRSTFQGLLERSNSRLRPYILTRSFFAGSQRYASVWTGDNMAEWSHLEMSIPMLLSLGIAGIPFVGADVGGFFKNPDEELLVRWYQAGAYQPFFRAHAHIDTKRREPWLFSENSKQLIREAIRRRYKLLPYWYTAFYEHTKTGLPVMRPLWIEFPEDKYAFDEQKEFMIGNAILVRPVAEPGVQTVSVYLPGQNSIWYDFDTLKGQPGPGAVHINSPLEKIPVYIRGGKIIPLRERVRRSSLATIHDPYTLIVALDLDGYYANGTLYEDDGHSYDYRQAKYNLRRFEFSVTDKAQLTSRSLAEEAHHQTDAWIEKIVIVGLRGFPHVIKLESGGKTSTLTFSTDEKTRAVNIRKPGVSIDKDWTITLKF